MCWLYILTNDKTRRYYVGSTNNLDKRLKQHLAGYTRTTRILKTDKLIYIEQFSSIYQARLRERQIKSMKSRKYIEKLINSKGH